MERTENLDVIVEMEKALSEEMSMTKEERYQRIRDILNIKSFMNATDNNLDMLYKYMYSATKGIRLSNLEVGEFIKDEYGDDFFLRKEELRCEEYVRDSIGNKMIMDLPIKYHKHFKTELNIFVRDDV